MIILRNINSDDEAQRSLKRLVMKLRGVADGTAQPVDVSAGLALWPADGATPSELLRTADRRMYADKMRRSAGKPSLSDEQLDFDVMQWSPGQMS